MTKRKLTIHMEEPSTSMVADLTVLEKKELFQETKNPAKGIVTLVAETFFVINNETFQKTKKYENVKIGDVLTGLE